MGKKERKRIESPSRQGRPIQSGDIPAGPASSGLSLLKDNSLIHLSFVAILILFVYGNTLHAPFQWDENGFLVNNPYIKDLHYFVHPSETKGQLILHGDFINRYVGYLTFALNYRIHGFSVAGYHAVNIAIHIANAILVYVLVLLIFRTPFMAASHVRDRSRQIALFSSLLFAAHPLQTEAVTYVYQRLASLVAFFYLLSLTAYIRSRISQDRRNRFLFSSIAFLSAVLAMKTKENAFTLPFMIALFELCFLEGPLKRRLFALAPILLTLAIIPLTIVGLAGTPSHPASYTSGIVLSRIDYFLTQCTVIVKYLRLFLFPVHQNLLHDQPARTSFFDPQVFLSFALLTMLFAFGIYLVLAINRRRNSPASPLLDTPGLRLIGFGILWFFIALSVESSFMPLYQLIDEYRMYLPSVGLIVSIVTGAFLLKERLRIGSASLTGFFVVAVAVLSFTTYTRNELWNDKIRFWEDIVRESPGRALAHYNLGTAYTENNMPDKALGQYLIAVKLDPYYVDAHNNLGNVYQEARLFDKAIEQYQIVVDLKPDHLLAHYNMAVALQSLNMLDRAIEQYLTVIRLNPSDADAQNNLGVIYAAKNMFDKAIEHYQRAISLKPDNAMAHYNLGYAYQRTGQREKAVRELTEALRIDPNYHDAQQLLQKLSQ